MWACASPLKKAPLLARLLLTLSLLLYADFLNMSIGCEASAEGKQQQPSETDEHPRYLHAVLPDMAGIKDNYDVFISLVSANDYALIQDTVMKTGVIDLVMAS